MPPKRRNKKPVIKRKCRSQRLNTITSKLIGAALHARGISLSRIITEWPEIAGDAADWCTPESIRFPPQKRDGGTLTVAVASGRGPEMQMLSEDIIARVNQVFGYGAISRITITQTTRAQSLDRSTALTVRKISPKDADKFNAARRDLPPNMNDNLRRALDRLGKSLSCDKTSGKD